MNNSRNSGISDLKKISTLGIAQSLVFLSLIATMISPPATNVFEGLALLMVLAIPDLRSRVLNTFKSPAGWWFLGFFAILSAGLIYGIETPSNIYDSMTGWRKILMLPIAAGIFSGSSGAKGKAVIGFTVFGGLFVLYSYLTYFFPQIFPYLEIPGVVVRNHAAQGLFFSVLTIAALGLIRYELIVSSYGKAVMYGLALTSALNVVLIATGRSSYVALLVMLSIFIFVSGTEWRFRRKVLSVAVLAALLVTLSVVGTRSQEKWLQAYNEASTEQTRETSVGIRLIFWKTSADMLFEHPVLGVGTGGFEKAYGLAVADKSGLEATVTNDPHNQFIKIAIEQGFLGLLFFVGLLVAVARQCSQGFSRAMGFCVLLGWCTTSLANSHFSTFTEGHFIWIWLGMVSAAEGLAAKGLRENP